MLVPCTLDFEKDVLRGLEKLVGIEGPIHHRERAIVDVIERRPFGRVLGRVLIVRLSILVLHRAVTGRKRRATELAIDEISNAGE